MGTAMTPAAAEAVPPEPAQVQPSYDPYGRSEAEESRTGLNPVCLPWLQFSGLRTTLNNSSSHVDKIIAKTWRGAWENSEGCSLGREFFFPFSFNDRVSGIWLTTMAKDEWQRVFLPFQDTHLDCLIFVVLKDLENYLHKHGQIEAIYSPVFPGTYIFMK